MLFRSAVALTLRRRKDTKTQDIAEQVRTRAQDRVRIVTNILGREPTSSFRVMSNF